VLLRIEKLASDIDFHAEFDHAGPPDAKELSRPGRHPNEDPQSLLPHAISHSLEATKAPNPKPGAAQDWSLDGR
jgi:hypothetical protein